jgi:hypothetical protein
MASDKPDIWETILESERLQGSTPTSASRSARLRLSPKPQVGYLPEIPRRLSEIEPFLRANFRGLCAGELPWPLFCHGPAGVGKTCAGLLLCDYAGGRYLTTYELAESLIRSQQGRLLWYQNGYGTTIHPEKFWEYLVKDAVVVLDELGARSNVSDFHYESVKRLIDCREGKPLVVLSNLNLDRIEKLYDDRVASRLSAGTVVKLLGEDRRLKK